LSRRLVNVNDSTVFRSILQLIAIATLVICNLHSPSMLHAQEAAHDHHAELVSSDHHELDADAGSDVDHAAVAHDHHGPSAMTVASLGLEFSAQIGSDRYVIAEPSALASWATAPPTQPPAT
jgi:hypothetical protein